MMMALLEQQAQDVWGVGDCLAGQEQAHGAWWL